MAARIWFVIAAAGAARRFGGNVAKPYLRLGGRTLLERALGTLMALPGVAGGVVVLAAGDRRFRRLPAALRRRVTIAPGSSTRARSVLNGLRELSAAAATDWVLVHDAARPCLPRRDLAALVATCRRDRIGGLLAVPVTDTLKRSDRAGRSRGSVPRERLWRAQTPQMFRYGALVRALTRALEAGIEPTDEAGALERLGLRPRLVEGSTLNIKVTRPADLELARAVLRAQQGRK